MYKWYLKYANWSKLCEEWRNISYSGSYSDCTKPTSRKRWLTYFSRHRDYNKMMTDESNAGLKGRIRYCKMLCSHVDCETEYIIPYPINIGQVEGVDTFEIWYSLYAPREPVVVVTSKEKLILLDFVVYILSCLSFWFEFCPLSLSDSLRNVTAKFVGWKEDSTRFARQARINAQVASRLNYIVQRLRHRRETRVRPSSTRVTRSTPRHDP